MKRTAIKLLVLALAMGGMAWAQDDDEPGRGVARLSLINGDVSVRRGDSGDWLAGAVNAPLVVEDSVVTGTNSRAEVQFDWANMIRLSSNTEIRLAELEHQRYIIQIPRGLVTFRVLRDYDADIEISTPSVSVRPSKQGVYRIAVLENGESEITVRSGEADIFTPRGSERLRAGRTMLARGSSSDPEYRIVAASGRDNWDRWNEDRDRFFSRTASYRYVDRSVYGADDLDAYGSWVYAPPYGWVWTPRVAAGWAPYYYGRWSWIDWYGWSWVSYDPWGWAPYHYGRWFYSSPHGWCWWPGGMRVRHYWRPALVAFIGWDSWGGVGGGIGFGRIGWVPLAPYETYHPWYGRRLYAGYRNTTIIDNSVHIVNNTNIVNVYKNARVMNAVTAVDANQFGRGNTNLIRVSQDQMRQVDLVRGTVPVTPRRESLRLSDRETTVRPVARTAGTERFVTRREPARVERVSFEEQQRAMEQVVNRRTARESGGGRVSGSGAPAGVGVSAGQGSAARPPAATGNDTGGWRRIGESRNAESPARNADNGWRRMGAATSRPDSGGTAAPPAAPSRNDTAPTVRRIPSEQAAPRTNAGAWRRFGAGESRPEAGGGSARQVEPGGASNAPTVHRIPAEQAAPRTDNGNWRRFEGQGAPSREPSGAVRNQPQARERVEFAPNRPMRVESPRSETAPSVRSERSAPIRISPPIVRQREAAPSSGPRMSQPSAPAVRSAPGGSFGSPRVESGGGGGRVARSEAPARTRTR